jgi:hypothetical protein
MKRPDDTVCTIDTTIALLLPNPFLWLRKAITDETYTY